MKLGLQVTYFTYPGGPAKIGEDFKRIVQGAEAAGFDSIWVMDHFFQIPSWGSPDLDMLEAYSALSYAAAATSKVKLGVLVTGITYRRPGVLVKTATTLDVLSGGRAYFGIGAAWYDEEHTGLGIPYPPQRERFEMLEETLQVAHQMWSDEVGPFEGKHVNMQETLNVPNSIQRPHPPILIGGEGEQKTFRLIARYGDACNLIIIPNEPENYMRGVPYAERKYVVLRERCDEIGRPYSDIEKTTLSGIILSRDGTKPEGAYESPERASVIEPGAAIDYFARLAEIGTDHAIVNMGTLHLPGAFDLWAEKVIPAVHKMVPAGR
jgi:F420-dependent oxidoreductase-like protein